MQPDRQGNYWQEGPAAAEDSPASSSLDAPQQTPVVTLNTTEPVSDDNSQLDARPPAQESNNLSGPIRWQANEYIHQEKNGLWFVAFGAVVIVMMAIAIMLMQAWTFALLIAVMAAAVVVYSQRPPRVLTYTLSVKGLHVGDHLYGFAEFKSFGIIRDGMEYSVMLIPTKRFMPGVTVYFPEELGEQIVDMLGARLPMQELHLDIIDRIVRKIRL